MRRRLVAIGTSLGGLSALNELLPELPKGFPAPVVIVQHRSKQSDAGLCALLQRSAALPVCEAEDKMPIEPGQVYVAAPDYHLLVENDHFSLSVDPPVNAARPSVDVLFETAASAFGAGTIAVVLTGLNTDGARGAQRVKAAGGVVIVQEPASAMAREMPDGAIARGSVDHVVALRAISPLLIQLCSGSGTRGGGSQVSPAGQR